MPARGARVKPDVAAMALTAEIDELAKGWIEYWRYHLETGTFPDTEASFVVDRLAREEPEIAPSNSVPARNPK